MSSIPDEVVQGDTPVAPPPLDSPTQTWGFRSSSRSLDRVLCHLADQWAQANRLGRLIQLTRKYGLILRITRILGLPPLPRPLIPSTGALLHPAPLSDRPRPLQDTVTAAAAAAATVGAATAAPPAHPHSHRHTVSVSTVNQRSSTSIFALAAAALDRTQNAIATISEPSIRYRQSNSTLSRLSLLPISNPSSEPSSPVRKYRFKSASNQSLLSSSNLDSALASQAPTANHPQSQPYATTDPNQPPPIKAPPATANKMHQTSSRLLRMTDDDRPFTRACTMVLQYLHLPRRFWCAGGSAASARA
ncbi:hypothetical protein EDB81DRAFT_951762 [Dactylonectria macrodidyma]|uniref:Uncharacterized protein n=1 Tax=Dactylonectria macrodidyma TaxID=307937 RepID=A0A9P9DRW4_9HYPO|nr:hypothetical protein EDB81DRAFT_951762 [Dactylonectria macrodidyma]